MTLLRLDTVCKEKTTVVEFGETVVLCCDEDLPNGYHFDKLQNLEWKVPNAEVTAKISKSPPKKTLREGIPCFS